MTMAGAPILTASVELDERAVHVHRAGALDPDARAPLERELPLCLDADEACPLISMSWVASMTILPSA